MVGEPFLGIEVDQDYLWRYSEKAAYCTTHAQIARWARDHRHQIPWFTCPNLPDASRAIKRLYPCDDGTLLLELNAGATYSADYRVSFNPGKITSFDGKDQLTWTKVRDSAARSFEKLPLFCWPQYESLTDALESLQKAFNKI